MKDLIVWALHTPAGSIAIISAMIAMSSPKGSLRHRKAGRYFSVSMLIMLMSGIAAAILKNSIDDIFLGAVVLYSVFTAWLTVYHKKGETNILEYLALTWIVFVAIAAYLAEPSWGAMRNQNTYSLWIGLAICFAIGDIRNLYHGGLSRTQRTIRHVVRIGFSLIWAALAFADKIIKILGMTIEEMPYIAIIPSAFILIIMLYWAIVILSSKNKTVIKHL